MRRRIVIVMEAAVSILVACGLVALIAEPDLHHAIPRMGWDFLGLSLGLALSAFLGGRRNPEGLKEARP